MARISKTREQVASSVFRPDQGVARTAPSGHAQEGAFCASHLHGLVRAKKTWHGDDQRGLPIHCLQKFSSLARIAACGVEPDFRQFLDVDSLRNVYDRVRPFAQAQAIAIFGGGWGGSANVIGEGLAGACRSRAVPVLDFDGPRNFHFERRAIERLRNRHFRVSRLTEHGLQTVAIQSHIKSVAASNYKLGWVFSVAYHRYV